MRFLEPALRDGTASMTVGNVDGGVVSLAVINFDPSFFWHYLLQPSQGYLQGLALTFGLAVAGQTLGVVIGLFAAFARLARAWPLRSIARLYTWVIRGTPLLVQIVFVYTALAAAGIFRFHDIQLGPLTFAGNIQAAIVALSLNEGAYMSEIIRAGILSVDPGQAEAAKSLGMTYAKSMRLVILPQAARFVIPPLGNEFNSMLKNTSLVSVIGVQELLLSTNTLVSATFRVFELLLVVATYYLLLTTAWGLVQSRIERYFGKSTSTTDGPSLFQRVTSFRRPPEADAVPDGR
jgi:polar amino acid transport system permease protein